ncbi:HTH-type transcriptional regulator NorG [Anaerotignum neopropionicum]|uniref:HTH-type transcriptional regulator NorG n=1 Tax=Anaerotignum neopropionicum TaxID=36847 RepID=A0A136WAY6_9FIRM|nr:PLP-dependent aminotransferase family protein [Anaerotignum neopropionicum]KXL51678.1 HTH-type transcriptional regulator NorG [Anaerotignum neopropionicum]
MPINSFENYHMSWKPELCDRSSPIYTRLAKKLEEDIKNGTLKPGDKLPPQRELADYLDLHLSTITRTYKLCEERGLLCAKVGQGTFVASDVHTSDILLYSKECADLIELGTVHPPYQDNEEIIKFMKKIFLQPDIRHFLEYKSPAGTNMQRKTVAAWLRKIDVNVGEENILLAAGSQNAICAILLGMFCAGDRIGTNSHSFSGLKSIAKMLGVQLIPLPEKNGVLNCNILERFCEAENLKGLYFVPEYHNPTTHSLTDEERACIGKIAKKLDLIILEDAINRMLRNTAQRPLFAYALEQTIHIFSVSKFLCPGLRMAYISTPFSFKAALNTALYNMNLMVSPLNAEIVNRIFNAGILDKIIEEKQIELRKRNSLVNQLLGDYELYGEDTCSFRWLMLPPQWKNGMEFEEYAKSMGLQVFCAEKFSVGNVISPKAIRICVSAPPTIEKLQIGIEKLSKALLRV